MVLILSALAEYSISPHSLWNVEILPLGSRCPAYLGKTAIYRNSVCWIPWINCCRLWIYCQASQRCLPNLAILFSYMILWKAFLIGQITAIYRNLCRCWVDTKFHPLMIMSNGQPDWQLCHKRGRTFSEMVLAMASDCIVFQIFQ